MKFDIGVTAEPCEGGNPDRGCIYLGIIDDETGPFAATAPALVGGQKAFWATVNATGGIAGAFDVTIPDDLVKDGQYKPDVTVQKYTQIADSIAALAMLLGTPQGIATLDSMKADNTIAAPMTWWSGWGFDSTDYGLVLEFGTNYCFEAMNAVDWAIQAVPAAGRSTVASVGIVKFPGDYGDDYAAGVAKAAEADGLKVAWQQVIIPASAGGDPTQAEAVAKIAADPVDVVFVVSGPSELAAVVGGAAQVLGEKVPIFIGASPTWNPGLLKTAASAAFELGIYYQSAPFGPWGYDSVGHEKMRTALGDVPGNFFFVAGWASQYALKAAFEAAYAAGDLTKAGIYAAAQNLTDVDYEGMMPARSFAGAPNDVFPRGSLMSGVDTSAVDGVSVLKDFFTGPTAAKYDFTEPCAKP
ncbi:MAG TPA: branched-chain amino acid ABC transporter substrate-binding protein [Actinobacteria bacterium]|nr:branched-chain amino acid ABC transporter substrate-binding protein [Actinomycetota bacterium]